MSLPTAAQVEATRGRGDLAGALSLALDCWRSGPAPVIADAIDALDIRGRDGCEPPRGRSRVEFQEAWLAAARERPTDVLLTGHLARTLATRLPVDRRLRTLLSARWRQSPLIERIDVLEARGADPRTATALFEILCSGKLDVRGTGEARTAYGRLADALVAMGDRRHVPGLLEVVDTSPAPTWAAREFMRRDLPAYIARLEALPQPEEPDDLHTWRRLAGQQGNETRQAGDLLAAIHANPFDEGLRRVYSDMLQETGDPRGEFIALQFAAVEGRAPRKDQRRMRQLWREHLVDWIGADLERTLIRPVAAGGFLHAADLAAKTRATADAWIRAPQDPRLSTLHTLQRSRGTIPNYIAFVTSPHARNLRVIEAPSGLLDHLLGAEWPQRLEQVTLYSQRDAQRLCADGGAAPAFGELRRLILSPTATGVPIGNRMLRMLEDSGWLARLTHLHLHTVSRDQQLPLLSRWAQNLPDTLLNLRIGLAGEIELDRGEEGLCCTLGPGAAEQADAFVAVLPPDTALLRVPTETANLLGDRIAAAAQQHHPRMRLETLD